MAIAHVKDATAAAYGPSTTQTISLNSVGSGNCLVCCVAGYYHEVTSIKDAALNAFTQGVRASSSGGWVEIWYLLNAAGGNMDITVTTPSGTYQTLFLAEFSGVDTAGQPRTTGTGTLGSTAASTLSTGSLTTTSGDLIVTALSLTASGGTLTWNSGETTAGNQMNAGGNESGAMGWILSSGGSAARQASWTSASSFAALAAVALKPAAVSASTAHNLLLLGCGT